MRILVVEDEQDLARLIEKKLTGAGYSVDCCHDGGEASDILSYTLYDGIILDVMLPKKDGFTILRELRERGVTTPVIMLTARDSTSDIVRGLDLGANDYLSKPFSFEELMARIRSMIRASSGNVSNVLQVGDLTLDSGTGRVCRGDREIDLSAKEYQLLEYLMHNKGVILSREQIEDHIWNFDYEGGTNVVDVYISYLRKTIDTTGESRLIHTVRGRGYVLREEK